jgi:hypothetical protein
VTGAGGGGGSFNKPNRHPGGEVPDVELRRLVRVLDGDARASEAGPEVLFVEPDQIHWPQWCTDWLGPPPERLLMPTEQEIDDAARALAAGVADPAILGPTWVRAHGAMALNVLVRAWQAHS